MDVPARAARERGAPPIVAQRNSDRRARSTRATATLLIAGTLVALAFSGCGSDALPPPAREATARPATPGAPKRVTLTVRRAGEKLGKVFSQPSGIACGKACRHEYRNGVRVTLTVEESPLSRFEGWSGDCEGSELCLLRLDSDKKVIARFSPPAEPLECTDGRDNDRDGLVDGRDPGCEDDATEADDDAPAGSDPTATSTAPAPPPVPAPSQCRDGIDNDGDGLIDRSQDPGCEKDGSESDGGASAPPECYDATDNDGDGLIDAGDPGCRGDSSEAPDNRSQCADGRDNDGDGVTDARDPGCIGSSRESAR